MPLYHPGAVRDDCERTARAYGIKKYTLDLSGRHPTIEVTPGHKEVIVGRYISATYSWLVPVGKPKKSTRKAK